MMYSAPYLSEVGVCKLHTGIQAAPLQSMSHRVNHVHMGAAIISYRSNDRHIKKMSEGLKHGRDDKTKFTR